MKWFTIIKEKAFKTWVDYSEVSVIFYKLRLFIKRKAGTLRRPFMVYPYKGYELVFDETFTTPLDKDKWGTGQNWGRVHPKQAYQYSSDSCINIVDGKLELINKYEPKTGTQWAGQEEEFHYKTTYTHGDIESKEEFLYGIYEARCKIPYGSNATTAFWLSSIDSREIDIFEFFPKDNHKNTKGQLVTVHWPVKNKTDDYDRQMSPKEYRLPLNIMNEFHKYTLIWTKESMTFLFDDMVIRKLKNKRVLNYNDKPCTIKVGNGLTKEPSVVDVNLEPSTFYVDYIKVWQKV